MFPAAISTGGRVGWHRLDTNQTMDESRLDKRFGADRRDTSTTVL
jgi:hypothetical protein